MREILFRGKVKLPINYRGYNLSYRNGDWVYGLMNSNENIRGIFVDINTIGQYTGLDDKNGIKIFEGDIVKVDDDYETFGKMAGEIREVWFKDGGFRLKPKYVSSVARGDRGCWLDDGAVFEVIGNIYDNPELLGGDSE